MIDFTYCRAYLVSLSGPAVQAPVRFTANLTPWRLIYSVRSQHSSYRKYSVSPRTTGRMCLHQVSSIVSFMYSLITVRQSYLKGRNGMVFQRMKISLSICKALGYKDYIFFYEEQVNNNLLFKSSLHAPTITFFFQLLTTDRSKLRSNSPSQKSAKSIENSLKHSFWKL